MPLLASTLESYLTLLFDSSDPGFVGWPATPEEVAENWGAAFGAYLSEIAYPPGAALLVILAAPAFDDAFTAAFTPSTGMAALQAGCAAVTTLLAVEMAALGGVPLAPPGVFTAPVLSPTLDPAVPAASIAASIHTWVITGTYAVPPAAPLPWS